MKSLTNNLSNEQGFVLITSLLMLTILMIIGIAATNTTTIELQISGNDKAYKQTFYQADGSTEVAARLVEESLGTPGGFSKFNSTTKILDYPDSSNPNKTILVYDPTLSDNADTSRDENSVSDASRDLAFFPGGYDSSLADPEAMPHTNIIADGVTSNEAGSGLQMLAGYEGKGKGTAGGGGRIIYTIYAQQMNRSQVSTVMKPGWRHVIGQEMEGNY